MGCLVAADGPAGDDDVAGARRPAGELGGRLSPYGVAFRAPTTASPARQHGSPIPYRIEAGRARRPAAPGSRGAPSVSSNRVGVRRAHRIAPSRAVAERLGEMRLSDAMAPLEIGDRAGDPEQAGDRPSGEAVCAGRLVEEPRLRSAADCTRRAARRRRARAGARAPRVWRTSRAHHVLEQLLGGRVTPALARAVPRDRVWARATTKSMRSIERAPIRLSSARPEQAGTCSALGVAEEAARARVRRADEGEARGERRASLRSDQRDVPSSSGCRRPAAPPDRTRASRRGTARRCARATPPRARRRASAHQSRDRAEWCGARNGRTPRARRVVESGDRVDERGLRVARLRESGGRIAGSRGRASSCPNPADRPSARCARRPRDRERALGRLLADDSAKSRAGAGRVAAASDVEASAGAGSPRRSSARCSRGR